MNENIIKRNELLAKSTIKELETRNIKGYYAKDKEEALKLALDLIPKGSSISMGGCQSAKDIGLVDIINSDDYNYIDREKLDRRESLIRGYDADVFISSVNAMSQDGILVNIDGNSNRVSYICQGPKTTLLKELEMLQLLLTLKDLILVHHVRKQVNVSIVNQWILSVVNS